MKDFKSILLENPRHKFVKMSVSGLIAEAEEELEIMIKDNPDNYSWCYPVKAFDLGLSPEGLKSFYEEVMKESHTTEMGIRLSMATDARFESGINFSINRGNES